MNYIIYVIVIIILFLTILYLVNNHTVSKSTTLLTNQPYVSKIPKVFMQTAKRDLSTKYIKHLQPYIQGIKYEFYKDEDILKYFKNNPIPEFPNVSELFRSMKYGEHKADLFRYYYLYLNGGTYMDSDILLFKHIDDINKNYEFVSLITGSQISQSYLSATPRHPLIYEALKDVYHININNLNKDYFLLVNNLTKIYNTFISSKNSKNSKTFISSKPHLYQLEYKLLRGFGKQSYYYVKHNDEMILKHFSRSKTSEVPDNEIVL